MVDKKFDMLKKVVGAYIYIKLKMFSKIGLSVKNTLCTCIRVSFLVNKILFYDVKYGRADNSNLIASVT